MRFGLMKPKAVLAAAVMLLAAAVPAHAAFGAKASLAGGMVNVSGTQAEKAAPITWEGIVVTSANKGGSFAFTTTTIPADCVGTVSDGKNSLEVRIEGCGGGAVNLLATGQITSYAPGDDGHLRVGATLSYSDNGDGTVTDNRTGLTWEMKTTANLTTNYNWQGALDYVAELNAMNGGSGYAGHNDWRLPNIRELLSILDYSRSNPPVDPIFGPTAGGSNYAAYWSSTSWAGFSPEGNAWAVEFADGYSNYVGVLAFGKSSALRVRAVRGGL